jgi:hypothetical protein
MFQSSSCSLPISRVNDELLLKHLVLLSNAFRFRFSLSRSITYLFCHLPYLCQSYEMMIIIGGLRCGFSQKRFCEKCEENEARKQFAARNSSQPNLYAMRLVEAEIIFTRRGISVISSTARGR